MNDNKPDGVRNQRQGPGPHRRAWLITSIAAAAVIVLFGGWWGTSAALQWADRDQSSVREAGQPGGTEDQRGAHPGGTEDQRGAHPGDANGQAGPGADDQHPESGTGLAAVAPGWQPDVQQWFKDREQLQIDLNNTLIIVARQTSLSPEAITACNRLADVTHRLQLSEHSPEGKLDAPMGAGIEQFSHAAQACLSGDFPAMGRQIADGLQHRASVQNDIDEILDGDA